MYQGSTATRNKVVSLFPFLIAAFLFIDPLLEWVFRRFKIQKEKLQFWVMLTSGTAWILALVYFLLNPTSDLNKIPGSGNDLLPGLTFTHDWITASLILSAVGLIFLTILSRQEDPHSNAWLSGLGGACVIGVVSNSAYTLGLIWTIVEGFHFYFSYRDQQIASNPRNHLPAVLMRLSAPAALILFTLTGNESGKLRLITDPEPHKGLILIAVGLIGFLGWFFSYHKKEEDQPIGYPGATENWVPGMLGLLLILRGGTMMEPTLSLIPISLSSLLLIAALIGLLFGNSSGMWFLSCGIMVAVSTIISGAESALSWGITMILPGIQLWKLSSQPRISLIPLILSAVGILPLPFLPSWAGVSAFSAGVPGVILGISYGIFLGSVLITVLKNWGVPRKDAGSLPLLGIIGASAILISQFLIAIKLDLISGSRDLLGKPILIWISLLGLLPVLLLGNRLPLGKRKRLEIAVSRLGERSGNALSATAHFLDRLVGLLALIFEGQGGLIWALLFGLLLITLISLRGG